MSSMYNMPWTQAIDGAGNTLAGAKLYFYQAGTSTLQNVYADNDLTVALSNPVVADGGGRFVPIYLADAQYKVMLYTASDVLVWSADNINAVQTDNGTFAANAVNTVLEQTGLTPNVAENLPYAIFKYANAATFYTDTGTSENSYILEPVGDYDNSVSDYPYFVGFSAQFVCKRPNTGTSLVQVNVNGHGAKYIRRFDGTPLIEGELSGLVKLIYDGVYFLLISDNSSFSIGDIKSSVLSANHGDWLLCNGQAVSRTDYAVLFDLIGTNFGIGDGSTTFNVPDYQGKFLRGLGGNSEADVYTTQAEGLPNITGTAQIKEGHNAPFGIALTSGCIEGSDEGEISYPTGGQDLIGTWSRNLDIDASKSSSIYGASEHVTPINQAVNYFIKAR